MNRCWNVHHRRYQYTHFCRRSNCPRCSGSHRDCCHRCCLRSRPHLSPRAESHRVGRRRDSKHPANCCRHSHHHRDHPTARCSGYRRYSPSRSHQVPKGTNQHSAHRQHAYCLQHPPKNCNNVSRCKSTRMVCWMSGVPGRTSHLHHYRGNHLDHTLRRHLGQDICHRWGRSSCRPNRLHLRRSIVVDPAGIHRTLRSVHSNRGRDCRSAHHHLCRWPASNWWGDGRHPIQKHRRGRTNHHRRYLDSRGCLAKICRCWDNHRPHWRTHQHRRRHSHGDHRRCNPRLSDTCQRWVHRDSHRNHLHQNRSTDRQNWVDHPSCLG